MTASATGQFIDDGDPGFSSVGSWAAVSKPEALGADLHYSAAGSGSNVATWSFTVTPGQYEVAATWVAAPNRATNAPFTVLDGIDERGTAFLNQELAPDDFTDVGVDWEDFGGTYNIIGTNLVVTLSNLANEFVIADGIRILRVGDVILEPEIELSLDGDDVPDNTGSVYFGSTDVGVPVTRMFTVENTGFGPLNLGSISLPPGFSLAAGFGSTTLLTGETTTFTVQLDAGSVGAPGGQLSFGNNDADEDPYNFAISGSVGTVDIIDDGDAGFSTVGAWTHRINPIVDAYLDDVHYSAAGTGADVATWSFSITPGLYRVAATWNPDPNRATNSPFVITDGSTTLGSVAINQQLAPDDFSDQGVGWENLGGVYAVNAATLQVKLSDNANGYVIADAVRIERMGDLPPGPEISVTLGSIDVPDNSGSVNYGSTNVGVPVTKTLTVQNVGLTTLTLGSITIPSTGYTLESGFGDTSLDPGEWTTFSVRLDATSVGTFTGEVSFANNDGNEHPYNFTVSGTVTTASLARIIDDGDPGFTTSGSWIHKSVVGAFLFDHTYSAAGSGSDVATWTFSGLTPGQYEVAATWLPLENRATDAPFTVYDNLTVVGTASVNQELAPNDFSDQGANWETIGTFNISSNRLIVKLSDAANEFVIADAVRIARVGEIVLAPEIQVLAAGSNIVDGGTVNFGTTVQGIPITKTLTVKNLGVGANLTLTPITPASMPAGYLLVSNFGSTTLLPNETTTFQIRLTATSEGTFGGPISFGNNDSDENPFDLNLTGQVATTGVRIIDDGDAGFGTTGSWEHRTVSAAFQGDHTFSAAGGGSDVATWTFSAISPGQYNVAATWLEQGNRATDSPFEVFDGYTSRGTVAINQEQAPDDFSDAGANWENLGIFNITGNTLMVTLNDAADEYVMADGIRIERVGPPLLMAPALDLSWVEAASSNSDDDDDDTKEEQAVDLILQMDDLLS